MPFKDKARRAAYMRRYRKRYKARLLRLNRALTLFHKDLTGLKPHEKAKLLDQLGISLKGVLPFDKSRRPKKR